MSCDFIALARSGVQQLSPYQPGKPIEELQRELGLSNIVKLASNENPLGPSDSALKAINDCAAGITRYPDGNGFELKRALAERLSVDAEQITLGNGSNDVLDLLAQTFLGSNTSAVYSDHAFIVYQLAIMASGAKGIAVRASDWGHDLAAMEKAIGSDTRMVFIANPNNPTGTYLALTEVKAFLEKVSEDIIVVLDEAYVEYLDEQHSQDSIRLLDHYKNLVITRTFSKAFGLAGLRIGYSVSNPDIANLLNRVRAPFNVNSMALAAATAVLQHEDYLQRSREVNRQGMAQLEASFKKLELPFIPSKGNFISVELPVDAMQVYQDLLQQGVIVRPVGVYAMPDHLRVSIGLQEENEILINALAKVLDR